MPILQELKARDIHECLRGAADRSVPMTITLRVGECWENLRSRFLSVVGGKVFVDQPVPYDDQPPREFAPGDQFGASFKYKHHKHVFTATVKGSEPVTLDDGSEVRALVIEHPAQMKRMQRRAYFRVDVPPGKIVRGSFWLGNKDSEPSGPSQEQPVWSGEVTNLSAGGIQIATDASSLDYMDVGDLVGARIAFGTERQSVNVDAVFRHGEEQGERALLGFQFIGLDVTQDGQEALKFISDQVRELEKAGGRETAFAPSRS